MYLLLSVVCMNDFSKLLLLVFLIVQNGFTDFNDFLSLSLSLSLLFSFFLLAANPLFVDSVTQLFWFRTKLLNVAKYERKGMTKRIKFVWKETLNERFQRERPSWRESPKKRTEEDFLEKKEKKN